MGGRGGPAFARPARRPPPSLRNAALATRREKRTWRMAAPPPGRDAPPDPTLYLPAGPAGDGFLTLSLDDGSLLAVPLTAAKARLLAALAQALREDAALVGPVRGWRRPERLARMVAGDACPVEAQTVRAYLSQIKRSVRAAA